MRDYVNCICYMQLLAFFPQLVDCSLSRGVSFSFNRVCSVSATQVFLSWTFSSALSQEKHTSKKNIYLYPGFRLPMLQYFFPGLRVCPPPLFFFFGSFIFLWYWEFVDEGLLICCVFSPSPSPHYSSPFTPFKSFRY